MADPICLQNFPTGEACPGEKPELKVHAPAQAGTPTDGRPPQAGRDLAAEEVVRALIAAYLRPPMHISTHFYCL